MIACLDQHSRPKIGNLILVGSLHIQTNAINLCIGREYRLRRNDRKIEIDFIDRAHTSTITWKTFNKSRHYSTYRKFLEALQVPKELAVAKIFPAILNTILLLHFLSSAQFCLGGFLLLKLQIMKGKPFFIEGHRYLDIIIDSCEIGMWFIFSWKSLPSRSLCMMLSMLISPSAMAKAIYPESGRRRKP